MGILITLAALAVDMAESWDDYPDDLPKRGDHERPADGEPPPWLDRFTGTRVDATHVEAIDEQRHDLECSCGCQGEATVIKEKGVDGAYIACTVDAVTYLQSRGSRGDGAA